MTRVAALELAEYGVTVNAIAPSALSRSALTVMRNRIVIINSPRAMPRCGGVHAEQLKVPGNRAHRSGARDHDRLARRPLEQWALQRGESMSIGTAVDGVSTERAGATQANRVKPGGSRRRRLSPDEGREIARLYAETNTPTADIRTRFGIGESSLYRVLQQQGIPLRGRTSSPKPPRPQPALAPKARRNGPSSSGRQAVNRSTAPTPARGATVTRRRTPVTGSAAVQHGAARQRFRVQFQVVRLVEARDIRDAIRRVQSLGATEITQVVRMDE
jgi:transposase-like protein